MADNPGVSVVVPMYKVEQYIKLCIDSILAQTFQDFEIILVDDASPDGCFELCQKLYGDNDKIKFVRHEKNLGLGPARNTGIKHARGKYVYFVDSDDYILPEALEKFFNTAEKNNAQVVHANGWYDLTQDEPEPVRKENLTIRREKYDKPGFLKFDPIYRLEKHWMPYTTWSMAWLNFCRRDFLQENQIEFLPIISEDEPFSIALYCLTERFYIMHEAVYVYRRRTGSIMKTKNAEQLSKSIQSIVLGSTYVRGILNRLPEFENRERRCNDVVNKLFDRYIKNHVASYYALSPVPQEVWVAVKNTMEKFFGDNAFFVRKFFNGYNVMNQKNKTLTADLKASTQQRNKLKKQNAQLQKQNTQQQDFIASFIREQPALLNLMNAIKSDAKRIFVMSTPRHGNLGDQAIVLGEIHVLKKYFPDHEIIDIPTDYLTGELGKLFSGLGFEKYIRRDDIIFWPGGGNLGNLWINEENVRRAIIAQFPENKIVIFPQSIHFSDDAAGRKEIAASQKIYNAHGDLHLMTRDENSFKIAQEIFPQVKNYLLPDSVTALLGITDDCDDERKGVLFVLRSDKEKVRDDKNITSLQNYLAAKNIPFEVTDTVIKGRVTPDIREQKVREVLLKFRRSKLVITDRFHGVVFSFVTRTPVLAFKSFDTKISSGIKWFKNIPSIFYAQDKTEADMQNFIDKYYFAAEEAQISNAINCKVEIDSMGRFFAALDKIVATNKIYSIESSTPPRLPESVDNRVKRVFTLAVPLSICNFRCHYCYLSQRPEHYQGVQPTMKYSPEQVARALSPKRLGGLAFLNMCADGETLLLKDLDLYVKRLAESGHYPEIVTNCTITPMLEKILAFDRKLLGQIEFKCSFHYLELKKRNLLDRFAENVNRIWDAGASACVEITPSDELMPYIDEVKEFSLRNFGALPQITIARDDRTKGIEILSKLPGDEYFKTWDQFNSPFFDYKKILFSKHQDEFCYAGIWSAWINLATGEAKACYCGRELGDVFANPDSPFPTWPVGKCSIAYCYNGHAWLTWGDIPQSTECTYADMRNRVRNDGREWLQPKLKQFFSTHLCDNNAELSDLEKLKFMMMNRLGVS